MLESRGIMMGGVAAVEWLEQLPDNISDEIKDDTFCDKYQHVLNRVRYEVSRSMPVAPKVTKAIYKNIMIFITVGSVGSVSALILTSTVLIAAEQSNGALCFRGCTRNRDDEGNVR